MEVWQKHCKTQDCSCLSVCLETRYDYMLKKSYGDFSAVYELNDAMKQGEYIFFLFLLHQGRRHMLISRHSWIFMWDLGSVGDLSEIYHKLS